jgi:AraC-like DNA-binding protein
VSSGDLYIINPFVSHEFHAHEADALSLINIMFYVDFFDLNMQAERFISDVYGKLMGGVPEGNGKIDFIHLHGDRMYGFGRMFRDMLNEFEKKESGYLKVLHEQLSILLIYLFRDYANDKGKMGLTVWQKRCVESAIKKIDEGFVEEISVDAIAKNTGFCSLYFNKLFKLYTGESIPQYVRRKRIELACRLLAQTDKSIEQICIDVGYNDIKHFYKSFKENKKMTPGEYRKKSDFYINK